MYASMYVYMYYIYTHYNNVLNLIENNPIKQPFASIYIIIIIIPNRGIRYTRE
jgi:hypothetical protein